MRTIPTGALEAITCLPALKLWFRARPISFVSTLESAMLVLPSLHLGYDILMRIQMSVPIFNRGSMF